MTVHIQDTSRGWSEAKSEYARSYIEAIQGMRIFIEFRYTVAFRVARMFVSWTTHAELDSPSSSSNVAPCRAV